MDAWRADEGLMDDNKIDVADDLLAVRASK
jgi:hypothetical protein